MSVFIHSSLPYEPENIIHFEKPPFAFEASVIRVSHVDISQFLQKKSQVRNTGKLDFFKSLTQPGLTFIFRYKFYKIFETLAIAAGNTRPSIGEAGN